MNSIVRLLAIATWVSAIASPSTAAQFELIGTLPNHSFQPETSSADGLVTAGNSISPPSSRIVTVWTPETGATRLDPTLAEQHFVSDMSADGTRIVGYRRLNASGPETVAAIWDRATGQRLDLGVLPGDVSSLARHISGDGSTVIGVSQSPSGDVRAFRWSGATGMQFLGTLGGGYSSPSGLSFDGSTIVGGSANSGGQSRPFIWTQSTGMQQIPGLTAESYALGISSDGQSVLGRSLGSSWSAGLFFYRASAGLFDVDLNGGQFNFSMPANITADGTAAYGSAFFPIAGTTMLDTTAFVWRFGAGVSILDPTQSPALLDMSGDGELGVGYEIDASGFRRPLQWTQTTGITTLGAPAPGFSLTQASVVSQAEQNSILLAVRCPWRIR